MLAEDVLPENVGRTEQLSKKVTPDQLAERLKVVYNRDGVEAHNVDGAKAAAELAMKSFAQAVDYNGLSGDDILAPDVASLVQEVQMRNRKGQQLEDPEAQGEGEEEQEEEGSEDGDGGENGPRESPSK